MPKACGDQHGPVSAVYTRRFPDARISTASVGTGWSVREK